ncbi:MAG: P-loop NTPase [Acidobacteria bacterium]|nr:P-loop NTPase [Acidobacteriota bacterium]
MRTAALAKLFQVVSDLKSYLPEQVLEMRLRQWQPDVVLLDLETDIDLACDSIRYLLNRNPAVQVIGLHSKQDGNSIVRSLRAGAAEFLWMPFDAAAQLAAYERVVKLRAPAATEEPELGRVLGFASTKPGSGSSTLAAQCAFAIQRLSQKKVLLLDLDLMGGTVGFYLKIHHPHSFVELLDREELPTQREWEGLTAHFNGIDILPGPEEPVTVTVDPGRLHLVIEMVRKLYDFVVLDLPTIFHRTALLALSEADTACLVTTAELPSLHLTRKAIEMLDVLGFEKIRYSILVNRLSKQEGIAAGDVEKMFGASVRAVLPNDYFSLHRVVTRGEPLTQEAELGRAIERLAGKLTGVTAGQARKSKGFWGIKPVFSGT